MDDTNWVAGNIEDLEEILDIADDFYRLNDIQINKEKSELLLKLWRKGFNYDRKIHICFGSEIVALKPRHPNSSTRILGVWFNLNNNKRFVINQIKEEIINLSRTIKMKCNYITDKQALYIFNMLIIPKIEYRSQITVLKETQCNNIMKPYRKVFKHKLKFASTAPNAIMDNNLIYNVRNFLEVQKQSKITNFFVQLND